MVFYRQLTFVREKEYQAEILFHDEERNTEKNINFVSLEVLGPSMSKFSFFIFHFHKKSLPIWKLPVDT